MLDNIFSTVLSSDSASGISLGAFLICILTAAVIGAIFACAYKFRSDYTKSFVVTLALLPPVVTVVIMMVSGSIGAGVAVAGTFSLVRFRSVPGTAREICAIFLAMAAGLATGMGYIGFALLFSAIMAILWIGYSVSSFGSKNEPLEKTIRITIPEDLDYGGVFDATMKKYTTSWQLVSAKTTNMGSLYRLTYNVTLRSADIEKELMDDLRCKNGNLEISSSIRMAESAAL